jgi:N-methylhydantoinase A/oxoprolinase/acetone carboxylase beta subunit
MLNIFIFIILKGGEIVLIGIDVGGTYTDAVLIEGQQVIRWAKIPTRPELLSSLLEALDQIMEDTDPGTIQRVGLSTTLITNLIAENKVEPVALLAIPGPGVNPADFAVFKDAYLISGAIDFRGRETEKLGLEEVAAAVEDLEKKGIRKLAVVGKFSTRNSSQENEIAEWVWDNYPHLEVELGHKAAGKLNFPRRAVTTQLTAATRPAYQGFINQVSAALQERRIQAPVYILKADGGTLPLEKAVEVPVETIFSGPAASTMGVMALTPVGQTSVVVDIGGTTTDLALILSGQPLLSAKGARVQEHLTQVRAFSVKSVALGGDSSIKVEDGQLCLSPHRLGPAYCMGGPVPTPTDAMRVLGLTELGEEALAWEAMTKIAALLSPDHLDSGKDEAVAVAQQIINTVVKQIAAEIQDMFLEWEQEPAYRVWEMMHKEQVRLQNIVGVGGSAPFLVPLVAEQLGCTSIIPDNAPVANALGAALARPTLGVTLRVDTERKVYTVAEDGTQEQMNKLANYHLDEAEDLARKLLHNRAEMIGLGEYSQEAEVTHREMFNMIRGWSRVGRLIDIVVQIPAGLIPDWTH